MCIGIKRFKWFRPGQWTITSWRHSDNLGSKIGWCANYGLAKGFLANNPSITKVAELYLKSWAVLFIMMTISGMWWCQNWFLIINSVSRSIDHYHFEIIKTGALTWGKSESDDRRTFSGLRSQWTMFLLWRCLRATRICVTRNLVILSDNLPCSLDRIISSMSPTKVILVDLII